MTKIIKGRVLNCPCGAAFLPSLAEAVYDGKHTAAETLIYLPSQSLIEPLRAALMHRNEAVPHLAVLGKSDPAGIADFLKAASKREVMAKLGQIPRSIPELDRRLMITNLILKTAQRQAPSMDGAGVYIQIAPVSAYAIAGRIIGLMQELYDEGLGLEALFKLDGSLGSGREQISQRLLRQVLKGWLAHKAETGQIDPEEGRNRRMALEAEMIAQSQARVIVAGSTGSIHSTFQLMQAVLSRPAGAVILDGLDHHLDEESWSALAKHPEHPQFGLYQLLSKLSVARSDVAPISAPDNAQRARLFSEALRPASTTARWHTFIAKAPTPLLENVFSIEANHSQEEAEVAALILRDALEKPEQTAALITPDDKLMERVRFQLARHGIQPAGRTPEKDDPHRLARLAAWCAASGKLADLIAFVRHGAASASWWRAADVFDLGAHRQIWRPRHFIKLGQALARTQFAISAGDARHTALLRTPEQDWLEARGCATQLVTAFAPVVEHADSELPFAKWLEHHRATLEQLEAIGFNTIPDATRTLMDDLAARPRALTCDLESYAALFAEIAQAHAANQPSEPEIIHPRLSLWYPLDARGRSADVIILASLNEGVWPESPEPDPWANRKDRAFIGLSAPERRMGQAAHDFMTLSSGAATQVYLLRARTQNGSLTRPSRWLSRITILLKGAGQTGALTPPTPWLTRAQALRTPGTITPCAKPMPCPPHASRPRRMSVTTIETWLANPYAVYARHILKLEPLKRLDEHFDARDKGILIHAALQLFFEKYPENLPAAHGTSKLLELLDQAAESLGFALDDAPFWRPRFARFAEWFVAFEAGNRPQVMRINSEVGGKLQIPLAAGPFEVTARADRIDVLSNGALKIYDFKTSNAAAKTSISRGAPQLALEGLMAQKGAFSGLKGKERAAPPTAIDLAYITVTGGEPPGEVLHLKTDATDIIAQAEAGLLKQITRFDDPATPYAYAARAIYKDRSERDPFAHLARVAEWSHEPGAEEDGDD